MSDDEKSMWLSIAMGCIEVVKSEEQGIKKKGSRVSVLNNLYENAGRSIDLYRLVEWPLPKLLIASAVLEKIELEIKQKFSPKLVGRDSKGRFIALANGV